MHFYIVTAFPEMFPGPLEYSISGKALKNNLFSLDLISLKKYAVANKIDDKICGGGIGMLIRPDVVGKALDDLIQKITQNYNPHNTKINPIKQNDTAHNTTQIDTEKYTENKKNTEKIKNHYHICYMTPRGQKLTQKKILDLKEKSNIIILCGRYEGVDQRVSDFYELDEISIGDFILSGGEIPAMCLIDACVRYQTGVIQKHQTLTEESFSLKDEKGNLLLEYDQYTQPTMWKGLQVPKILLSGHHQKIKQWKMNNAKTITQNKKNLNTTKN